LVGMNYLAGLKNSVAANNSITATSNTVKINRIAGISDGGTNNNYANSDMTITVDGITVSRPDDATVNGTGKTIAQLQQESFYTTAGNWYGGAWNFTTIWKICTGITLPFFQWEGINCNPIYTVTVSANPPTGGTVSGGGEYEEGTNVTLIATTEPDYDFVNWTENGAEVGISLSYTINNITANHTLIANFVIKTKMCNPVTNAEVIFIENNIAKIIWTGVEEAIKYEVTRNNNTVIVTTTEYTETFDFVNGTEYTWAIVTVCENGTSEPVIVSKLFVGINDITKTTFTIVPNPAHDKIKITANNNFNTIEIVNFLGQTVLSQSNDNRNATLDISNLSSGIYSIRIIAENGTSVKKFVKQ